MTICVPSLRKPGVQQVADVGPAAYEIRIHVLGE